MQGIKTLRDYDFKDKRVLIRADFNVTIKNGKITDATRIKAVLPTLDDLLKRGAKQLIIMSHLGRPEGKPDPESSLKPVAAALQALMKRNVAFCEDCIGYTLPKESLVVIENVRFHPEETSKNEEERKQFAKKLAHSAQAHIYVNDAFGSSHRKHASVYDIVKELPSCVGLLMEKEVEYLQRFISPPGTSVAILGGAKIEDKIDMILGLAQKYTAVVIGGGMAFTFYRAQGLSIGTSMVNADKVKDVQTLLSNQAYTSKILLPQQVVVTSLKDPKKKLKSLTPADYSTPQVVMNTAIPEGMIGLDVYPDQKSLDAIAHADTIYWNGPFGVFEVPDFMKGTAMVVDAISRNQKANVVAGGGDTLDALATLKKELPISTGGGASSDLILFGDLPALKILRA